ncbi:hypothetical protein ACIBJF_42990 [Streptomyces sp. NPDC050743]|uniref:hypothetical protein n=1 Tax=Streptomyces sp. NPDC050743 TaxID=3365634 RepID=UPI00379E5EE8
MGDAGQSVGLTIDEGVYDGSAGSLAGAEAGVVVAAPPEVAVAVADGKGPPVVAELPVVTGASEVEEVESGVGESVAVGVDVGVDGGPLGGSEELGDVLGAVVGSGVGLIAGRGRGAVGRSSVWPCGHSNRPRPSPATASTAPAARRAARTRRRARTPAYSACRCRGS